MEEKVNFDLGKNFDSKIFRIQNKSVMDKKYLWYKFI